MPMVTQNIKVLKLDTFSLIVGNVKLHPFAFIIPDIFFSVTERNSIYIAFWYKYNMLTWFLLIHKINKKTLEQIFQYFIWRIPHCDAKSIQHIWNVTHFLRFVCDRFQGINPYSRVLINAVCIQVFLSIWGRDVLTIFGNVLMLCIPPPQKKKKQK